MSAVSKLELAMSLCEGELSKKDAKQLVELFFEEMEACLLRGEPLKLSGFGGWSVRHKQARPGRNPRTKEAVTVTERQVISFKASGKLKKQILLLTDTPQAT